MPILKAIGFAGEYSKLRAMNYFQLRDSFWPMEFVFLSVGQQDLLGFLYWTLLCTWLGLGVSGFRTSDLRPPTSDFRFGSV